MKKLTLLFILAGLFSASKLYAYQTDKERQIRDSIFQKADSIQVDSLRAQFLREAFEQYIDKESSKEFLDSTITLSIRKGLHNEELWALFNYCRFYEYRTDFIMMQKRLVPLKEASYLYKDYAYYYTIWLNLLQARCALGDTEYVIIQAKEMRQEAIRLKYKGGEFIALLALAQAYDFNGDTEEAINTYKQALRLNPNANNEALMVIHGNMAKLYKKQKKYPQALNELQLHHDALTRVGPIATSMKGLFLGIEIAICKIYLEINDKENLNLHLKKATEYYDKNTYPNAYIDYHALWASYYKQIGEWDQCLNEYNLSISACKGVEPFYENSILRQYADALLEVGKYEEASKTYRTAILREDSLKQDMLQRHQEAHQANFKIQNALLEKELLTKRRLYIQGSAGIVILLVLVFSIIRAIYIHRQLKKSEEDTRLALETVEAADKMKDCFLHNITHEIRIPLNTVVGFAELLSSSEDELTEDELTEYSTVIKKNSTKLLSLINNILDLSRLEAGMMRFNTQENDVVQLCREAKMMVEMATPNIVRPIFSTELEELSFNIDSKWFLKLLTTLLSVPIDYNGEPYTIEYELTKGNGTINVLVKNSPLYQCWEDEQEQNILHNINRLYVETFKGSYEVLEKEGMKIVSITHPIS